MIEKLKYAWRRYRGTERQLRRISVDAAGVRLVSTESDRALWSVQWEALQEIVAYKADALVVDHICLAFRQADEEGFCVTDEETPGWEELNRALAERFGVDHSKWFSNVAHPAFAENHTVLWRRDSLPEAGRQ